MRFITQLPDRQHYSQIEGTEKYDRWQDKGSKQIEIRSPKSLPNPFGQEVELQPTVERSKADGGRYPSRVIFKVAPIADFTLKRVELIREIQKNFPYCKEAIFFTSFILENRGDKVPFYLSYAVLEIPQKILYLIRGLPGSGKSTLARSLCHSVFEADDGVYRYDAARIQEAHQNCLDRIEKAMAKGTEKIAVSNTFSQAWEFEPYLDLARKHGYQVHSIILESSPSFNRLDSTSS